MTELALTSVLLGGVGLVAGSFLALVSVRLPNGEEVMFDRSRCPHCHATLAARDLVPVMSWLWLRGRCRTCSALISPRYPLIELAAGAIGVWAAIHGGGWAMIAATAWLGWLLLLIGIVDGEHFWLPDGLTWPLIGTGLIAGAVVERGIPWSQAVGAVVGFGALWLLAALYKAVRRRDGLGGGDPFLFAGAGAWVGWIGLPSVLLWACLAGIALVLAQALVRGRVQMTDKLPFGTLLAGGIWLTWLMGPLGS